MKQIILLLSLLVIFPYSVLSQTPSNLNKAKALINKEFKENMNDYSSYSPVSFSSLDSLFTSIFDDPNFIELYFNQTIKYMEELNETFTNKIDITYDAKTLIKIIEEDSIKSQYREVFLSKLKLFDSSQAAMMRKINDFVPEFIGWKLTHKFRAKNAYNATILYEYVFKFDKNITSILSYSSIDD